MPLRLIVKRFKSNIFLVFYKGMWQANRSLNIHFSPVLSSVRRETRRDEARERDRPKEELVRLPIASSALVGWGSCSTTSSTLRHPPQLYLILCVEDSKDYTKITTTIAVELRKYVWSSWGKWWWCWLDCLLANCMWWSHAKEATNYSL